METIELVPVSEWTWNLYRVTYSRDKEGQDVAATEWMVATDSHIEGEVERSGPSFAHWFSWELMEAGIQEPKVIGNLYGLPVHESNPVDPARYGHR